MSNPRFHQIVHQHRKEKCACQTFSWGHWHEIHFSAIQLFVLSACEFVLLPVHDFLLKPLAFHIY